MIRSFTKKINDSGYPQLFGGTQIVIPDIFGKYLKQTNSDTVFQTVNLYFLVSRKTLVLQNNHSKCFCWFADGRGYF